jgi:hypothetical protein
MYRFFTVFMLIMMLYGCVTSTPTVNMPDNENTVPLVTPTTPLSETPVPPTVTPTETPTIVPTETLVPTFAEPALAELQSKLGKYTLVASEDGTYYQLKDTAGNIIPEIKSYKDGTANLSYAFAGGTKDLWIAFQAINTTNDTLTVGLWDYENGAWSQTQTDPAPKTPEDTKNFHTLTILLGHEREQQLIDTVFAARDMAMTESKTYNPKSEFEGITVTYNGKTIENFDVRPREWWIQNWTRAAKGAYRFKAISPNNEIGYDDLSSLAYARPIQVALGSGWFNLEIHNPDGSLQPPVVHVPIIAMNTDRSLIDISGLRLQSRMDTMIPLLNKDKRGRFFFWLLSQNYSKSSGLKKPDEELINFIVKVNQSFFEKVKMPEVGEHWTLTSLPEEVDQVLIPIYPREK